MKTRYLDVDDRTEDLRELLRANKDRAREFETKFELSVIYHDNALEGIVFSSNELIAALDPNQIAADASMVPIFTEIRNHKTALDFLREEARNKKGKITLTLLKKLYEMLGAGMEGRDKALYRKDIPLHRAYFHDIAQPSKIPDLMDKLVDYASSAEFREMHALNQAATIQWQLMQAYPYTENSGKLARLLSHLILMRQGYLPAIVHAVDRQRYYESLRLPVTVLRSLLLEAMENSLDNAVKFFRVEKPIAATANEGRAARPRRRG